MTTTAARVAALRAQIAALSSELEAADRDQDQAPTTENSRWEEGRAEARRRYPTRSTTSTTSDADQDDDHVPGATAANGRAEAARRHGRR
jgi:hypothetical protein